MDVSDCKNVPAATNDWGLYLMVAPLVFMLLHLEFLVALIFKLWLIPYRIKECFKP